MTERPTDTKRHAQHPECGECRELKCMDLWGGTEAVDRVFSVPGLDVHIVSSPFRDAQRGGDIYYLSMCGSGRVARLAIADVSGHGEAVADTSAALRRLMRKHINTPNQEHFARALNESFLSLSDEGTFAQRGGAQLRRA